MEPLLPTPMTRCPYTWKDQWWWIDYQIDLAADLLHEENYLLFLKHFNEMREMNWNWKDPRAIPR